jgi:plasmid stability protein
MTNLTISLDEAIVRKARIRAIEEGTSVSAKVREFLAQYARVDSASAVALPELPIFEGHGGLQHGIDPNSNKSMLRAADDFGSAVGGSM